MAPALGPLHRAATVSRTPFHCRQYTYALVSLAAKQTHRTGVSDEVCSVGIGLWCGAMEDEKTEKESPLPSAGGGGVRAAGDGGEGYVRGGVPRRAPPPSARVAIKEIDRRHVDDYIRLDRHRRKLIQMDKQRRKPRLASGILQHIPICLCTILSAAAGTTPKATTLALGPLPVNMMLAIAGVIVRLLVKGTA